MRKFLLSLLCAAAGFALSATEVCYVFSASSDDAAGVYGMTRYSGSSNNFNDNPQTLTAINNVTVTLNGQTRLWAKKGLRFYANSNMAISAPEGYTLTKISFWTTGASSFALPQGAIGSYATNDAVEIGGEKEKGGIWTGNNPTVTITCSATQDVSMLLITYETDKLSAAGLSFPQEAYEAELGKTFNQPMLTKATDAAAKYSSSNEEVATVDAGTGAITIVAAGSTVITVTTAETATYRAGTASYTLKVIDPNAPKAWEKVTSLSEISEDYDYIVVSQGSYTASKKDYTFTYAMNSAIISDKNELLTTSNVTIAEDGTISSIPEGVAVMNITKEDNKYIFSIPAENDAVNYLYCSEAKKAKFADTKSICDITITDGVATISTTITSNNKTETAKLQANPNSGNSPRFAFYTSAQKPIMLYRKAKELAAAPVETPKGMIDGDAVEHDGTFELKGTSKVLKFELPEGVNLWYKFEATVSNNTTEPEENNGIEALAEYTPEDGFEKYNHSKGIELKEAGTLTYYAEKDGTTGDKHVLTVSGEATGISAIEAETGAAEWYDLSGRKVAAPSKGVYVRKQGSKISKIAL